jgi:hypothetical protein
MHLEVLAFVVGVAVVLGLAVVSMRGAGPPRRHREGDVGPIVPIGRDHDHDVGGGDS